MKKDPTICDCPTCKEHSPYSRHVRVSPTLLLNIQYICESPTGSAIMAVEMDNEIIPKIRNLFRAAQMTNKVLGKQILNLAVGVVLDRLRRLSNQDSDDLIELLKVYHTATNNEELAAAGAGIVEIIKNEPVKVHKLNLIKGKENSNENRE